MADFRYVITVYRRDAQNGALAKHGYRHHDDASLAYAGFIQDARKEFAITDEIPSVNTRQDRRRGILQAVEVGPTIITLRRPNPTDLDAPPTQGRAMSVRMTTAQLAFTWGATLAFWGGIAAFICVKHGIRSLINFVVGFLLIISVIIGIGILFGLLVFGVSALRRMLMGTESGQRVEFLARRGLFYLYVIIVSPILALIFLVGAIAFLNQTIEIFVTPVEWLVAIVASLWALLRLIGIG